MSYIKIKDVIIQKNILKLTYETSDDLSVFFKQESLIIEYSEDISNTPKDIAVIPFITLVLPIAWVTNSSLEVDSLDKDFYDGIPMMKKGFIDMYREIKWKGNIKVNNIIDNSSEKHDKSSLFFSGGVDSLSSLINVLEEKPILVTVWGTDVWEEDIEGWKAAKSVTEKVKKRFNLKSAYIKSNFRLVIDEVALSEKYSRLLKDSWWHGVEHGIALLGHMAPFAYSMKIKTHYIAASFCEEDKFVRVGSHPTIDEHVKFCNCNVIHEGFDFTRQDKINNICGFFKNSKNKIDVRTCYMWRGGELNCCKCEKCYRTIMGIMVEKDNPNDYGYEIPHEDLIVIPNYLKEEGVFTRNNSAILKQWKCIQNKMLENKDFFQNSVGTSWMLEYNFDDLMPKKENIRNKIFRLIRKIFGEKISSLIYKLYKKMKK